MERGIRSEHLAILRCAITQGALTQLRPDEVTSVNQDIMKGNLFHTRMALLSLRYCIRKLWVPATQLRLSRHSRVK